DGIKVREFYLALVGALMVTALALILDALLAFAVWSATPGAGSLARLSRRRLPQPLLSDEIALESAGSRPSSPARHERGNASPTV
ncbi:ABC transporter permease, partial [Mycobacterium sp. ITM-2017-0098]